MSSLLNGVSFTSESHKSKVPLPPGMKASPDGSGLGADHFVVSMICTTAGVSERDRGAINAAVVMLSLVSALEPADGEC